MSLDWELIQAASVVVSMEFLVLGVIVLFVRAYRSPKRAHIQPEPARIYVPEPALLAGPYLQFSAPIPVAPRSAKFMAAGSEVYFPREADDEFGDCWTKEADWDDLIDPQPTPLRQVHRRATTLNQRGSAEHARRHQASRLA